MSYSTPARDDRNVIGFDGDTPPRFCSRVLHLREIPDDVTEAEVIALGLPFGEVTNVLILKQKNQALLEMASEEAAASMMNYYASDRPRLRHQRIYIKYSNYRELKTDIPHDQARDQAEWQAENTMSPGRYAVTRVRIPETGLPPGQGCVLRIIIDNLMYPVTLELLHQIFSKFGEVLRVVTFYRNNYFQALIQYSDPMHAYYAKMCLHGRSVYSGCCTLYVDFSKLVDLKIRYNNSKSRDFTRNDLPPGENMEPLMAAACGTQNVIIPAYAGAAGFLPPMGFAEGVDKFLFSKNVFAFGMPSDATNTLPGHLVSAVPGAFSSIAVMPSQYGEMHFPDVAGSPESTVLFVSNLNPDVITPKGLFNLFGMYGNVHRVKIMFRKKGTALVQMADATQAHLAVNYLNGQSVYGRVLHATVSKYQVVQLPREGQEGEGLTKDYTNSPLHRFNRLGTRNMQNIFPPSAVLQLSNIPPSVTIDDLKNLLTTMKLTVKAFQFFPNDSTMIVIQLGSVEEGVHALIELHNYDLGENHHLQVSFSKFII